MSMSDCIKCWNTPCSCGYAYRNYPKEYRITLAAVILGVPESSLNHDVIPEKHPLCTDGKESWDS